MLVKDIRPGPEESYPHKSLAVGGMLFFIANDGVHGRELWRSDGTEVGTALVKDVRPGSGSAGVTELVNAGGTLFFVADDGVHGRELWRSDGTEAGTVLVKDNGDGPGSITELTAAGNKVYYQAYDDVSGYEPWTSDGTTAGTRMLADIRPGLAGSLVWDYSIDWDASVARPFEFTAVGDVVYFTATDGSGKDLWKSDGTALGTARVDDAILPSGRGIERLVGFEDGVFFANAGTWWRHTYASGTAPIATLTPTPGATFTHIDAFGFQLAPTHVDIDGTLLFSAAGVGSTGRELWASDGTVAGTRLLRDIYPGPTDSLPREFVADGVGGALFSADDGTRGRELWRSDGTSAGTEIAADIAPGGRSGLNNAFDLVRSGDNVYFAADDQLHGIELWSIYASGTSREPDPPPDPSRDPDPDSSPTPDSHLDLEPGSPSPNPGSGQSRRANVGRLVVVRQATASRRFVRLSVRCVFAQTCAGTIRAQVRGRMRGSTKPTTLTAGRYEVSEGTATLVLALGRKGRGLLARGGPLRAWVTGRNVVARSVRVVGP